MLLYKNVDICDLNSIMQNGILSMDKCGNNNWADGKRANNDTSVVYLFDPIGKQNSFPKYGVALLEIDCKANKNTMSEMDRHKDDYKEYICQKVLPSEIKKVIIPEIFKHYVVVSKDIGIIWCEFKAEVYGNDGLEECDEEILNQFALTSELMNSSEVNFFRGRNKDRTMIDLYNIEYIF